MRQSAAEIDHGILDVAAGIFATHGYAHTSVQQIADAVGYSKPGLLHRFGSKDALHRAALAEVGDTVQELIGHATAHRDEPDQVRQVLELITRKALERPGMVQMMLAAFEPASQEPGTQEIQAAGYRLVDALDHPAGRSAERLRVVLAIKLIASAAMAQHSPGDADLHVDHDELVPLLVELAAQVMGASVGG
ncbi:MAG TPA: helix-turn-helix domain-containing protein [Marmoricola sp.]|nr:helix-turn-helix domain-containing protein [Marmoricola sp.]